MKIATLQFAPKLGDVHGNIQKANRLLGFAPSWGLLSSPNGEQNSDGARVGNDDAGIESLGLDILVLPEMAFTGKWV